MKSVKSVPKKLGCQVGLNSRKDAKKNTKVLWEVIKRTSYEMLSAFATAYFSS
jgi:hypothetical protein